MENELLKEKYEDFHRNADIQAKIVDRNNFTYHLVLSFLDKYLVSNMNVLDIGCGIGTISLYVSKKVNKVMGTDISERAVNAALKSALLLGIKNAFFEAISFLDADFQEKFDFIVCSEVLEHLPDDKQALRKIYELINENGILFLTVPSGNAPIHRLRKFLFRSDIFDKEVGHLRRYSKFNLSNLLKENKFEIIEMKLSEGILRNFLFVTPLGNKLLKFANVPVFRQIINVIDVICVKVFGESQIITMSKKKT
ncbi:MAG: class I SAM-dependent methyltransferase [Candidatus Omnitrophota bacterium]